ncbi:MAG: hypothetical protein DSY37_04690 [Hyperthermus sp.]|nr:MAG: hypothetical protein DSY37_04690 [Hyperthermus sp.]
MYELRNEKLAEIMSSRRFRIRVIMAELFMRDPLEEGRITIVSWRCGSDALRGGGVYEYDKENHLVRVHAYSGYGITSGVYGLHYRVNITVPRGSLLVLGGHGYDYYTWRTTRGKFFYIYEDNKYREMLSEALNQKLCSPESYACIAARDHKGNPMPAICVQAYWRRGSHRVWTLYRALILAPP